jgi:RNA polymerase sigma-70 factor (ECF subfamily)
MEGPEDRAGRVEEVGMTRALDVDQLYDASYRRLVVQLYAICGDLAEAEDAVQEAFVTALRRRSRLSRVDNPEAWVRTVAVNQLRHGWRHASVVRRYQPRVPGPQAPVDVGPEHVAIVTALAQVDDDQRRVVVLHYLADLPIAEIAAELGVPEGTVKSRLSRARARLADLLDENEEPHHV